MGQRHLLHMSCKSHGLLVDCSGWAPAQLGMRGLVCALATPSTPPMHASRAPHPCTSHSPVVLVCLPTPPHTHPTHPTTRNVYYDKAAEPQLLAARAPSHKKSGYNPYGYRGYRDWTMTMCVCVKGGERVRVYEQECPRLLARGCRWLCA